MSSSTTTSTKNKNKQKNNTHQSAFGREASAAGATAEAGWTVAEPKKAQRFGNPSGRSAPAEELLPTGWSAPVLTDTGKLSATASGVCACSTKEVKEMLSLTSSCPPAILGPTNVQDKGISTAVLFKDSAGRVHSRERFLFQLGPQPVTYNCAAPLRSTVGDLVRVVCTLIQTQCSKQVWEMAVKAPSTSIKLWLKEHASILTCDTSRPCFAAGSVRMVCYIPSAQRTASLEASGAAGVFVNPYLTSDADRQEFRVVPLESCMGLHAALQACKFHSCMGVVHMRSGLGLRIKPSDYETVLQCVRPDAAAQMSGNKFEISGLPLSMGVIGLSAFLGEWAVVPITTYRTKSTRVWIVRAQTDPLEQILQHELGIAVIKPALPRQQPTSATPRAFFSGERRPAANNFAATAAPSTWSEMVQGRAAPKASPAPPAVARGTATPTTAAAHATQNSVASTELDSQESLASAMAPSADAQQHSIAMMLKEALEIALAPMRADLLNLKSDLRAMREQEMDDIAISDLEDEEPSTPVQPSRRRRRQ